MRILLVVNSLLPSYGGPAFSVSRLAMALTNAGVDVGLWANEKSAATTSLLLTHPRLRPLSGAISSALDKFAPDIVHDNGIWLPHNHQLAQLAANRKIPRLVSTRGMLDPWAVAHKKWKKKAAWWLYQRRDLCRATCHHTTADTEAENLKRLALGVPITIIPNGIDLAAGRARQARTKGQRVALFLGRIHPVKGLPLLIEAWARLRPPGWQLQIAGPDEAGHRAEIERKVAIESLSDVVHFLGPLNGEAKERAFADADLFVLPSFSESFGMAIGEALAHSLPVLTTTRAPWSMLAVRGCGWSVAPTVDAMTVGLHNATSLEETVLVTMGERGRDLVKNDFAWPHIAKRFIVAYETMLTRKNEI